jgi:signal transduction histidine kinase
MEKTLNSTKKNSLSQLVETKHAHILLAILTFYILVWSFWILINNPFPGFSWSYISGVVNNVDPRYPAAKQISVGDQIISINGLSVYQARQLAGSRINDTAIFDVRRGEQEFQISVHLVGLPLSMLIPWLMIYPVSLAFWLIGTIVLLYNYSDKLANLFFLLCQIFCLTLCLGSVSAIGPLWTGWAFGLLEWWIGPILIDLHLGFSFPLYPTIRRNVKFLYAFALLFCLMDLARLYAGAAGPILFIKYTWLASLLLLAAAILIHFSRVAKNIEQRRKARILGLTALISFSPFLFLSLLPDLLVKNYIPYEISLLAVVFLPLGYSYAILRYRLIHMENYISRSVAYVAIVFAIGIIYGLVYFLTPHILPGSSQQSLLGLLIATILIMITNPLYRWMQRQIDNIFYGGWLDDSASINKIIQAITDVKGDIHTIALTLCNALQTSLRLEYVNLLLYDGRLVTSHMEPYDARKEPVFIDPNVTSLLLAKLPATVSRYFGTGEEVRGLLANEDWRNRTLVLGPDPRLWLLIGGKTSHEGLLLLGPRISGGEMMSNDFRVLEVVIRQAGAALENEFLLDQVTRRTKQITELHRQVEWVREEERKRIARDLHDNTVQSLVGINYRLANMRTRVSEDTAIELGELQNILRHVLREVRQICADLRPPALDSLGLLPALHARILEFKSQADFDIIFDYGPETLNKTFCSDEKELFIYRFINEAIINVQKHASAKNIHILLQGIEDNGITVVVEDDGSGFEPPVNLELLATDKHFGLIGLYEQANTLGGKMQIQSAPGKGCKIMATLPGTSESCPEKKGQFSEIEFNPEEM